jgi:hypothetical protein
MSRLEQTFITTLQAFLARHDPGARYSFEKCTGGMVNVTLRAIREADTNCDDPGRLPFGLQGELKSVIIKHAPPYVAGVGPKLPFSTDRQQN